MSEYGRNIIIEDPTLAAGFTQIPNGVLRHLGLSPGAKLAYVMLLSYAWQDGACFPGQETLARDMGCTDRSVRTYLKELQEHGLITIRQRGLNLTNLYILHRLGPETFSGPDRKRTARPVRKSLPTTKTQKTNTQRTNGRFQEKEKTTADDPAPIPDPVIEYRNMTPEQRLARSEQLERDRKQLDRALRALGTLVPGDR